jgi:peptidoglycan-associated lipoprotein
MRLAPRLAPVLLLAALPFALATGGCKKPEYPACKKDKHCKVDEGEKCVDKVCQNCTTDEQCKGKGPAGEDWVCQEFRCTDPAAAGVGGNGGLNEGAPCSQATDCFGGLSCKAGVCSRCSEDFDCNGGTCDLSTGLCTVPGGGGSGCGSDEDCAMDEICDAGMCVFSGVPEGGADPCNLKAVYFDFDSPKLTSETTSQLQAAATCIKEQGKLVYLEAHADVRGTEEYNLMLTDRRGQSVKGYLVDLGVPAENMQVISKGNLEATGADESTMKQDRRVEFIWP